MKWPTGVGQGVREAIGVFGRMSVTVEVVDNAARITTPEPVSRVVARKRGRLIYAGPLPRTGIAARPYCACGSADNADETVSR